MEKKRKTDIADTFGELFLDGRLTDNSDTKRYRLREAIELRKKSGRPLTDEEMKTFEI